MDYLVLLRKAYNISFKYKFLWLFGLFLGASGFSSGINYNFGGYNLKNGRPQEYKNFQNFLEENFIWIIIFGLILLFICLVFTFLRIASESALISSVDQIAEKKEINFVKAFKLGLRYFWRVLIIKLLLGALAFAVLAMLLVPSIVLFTLNMPFRGLILLLFSLAVLIPFLMVMFFISIFSLRFTIVKNQGVIKSIKSGAFLLKENIGSSLIIFLILFGIRVAVSIALVLFLIFLFSIFGIPGLLSLVLGIISRSLLTMLGFIPLLIMAMLALLTVSFLINAILNTYSSTLWTLTFRELTRD